MADIKLNPNQADFMQCDDQVIAFFGGIGNGKTFAGILKGSCESLMEIIAHN